MLIAQKGLVSFAAKKTKKGLPLPPNGKAFQISFLQNFSMSRRSKENICMIPLRFRTPQNCVFMKNLERNCLASRREDVTLDLSMR